MQSVSQHSISKLTKESRSAVRMGVSPHMAVVCPVHSQKFRPQGLSRKEEQSEAAGTGNRKYFQPYLKRLRSSVFEALTSVIQKRVLTPCSLADV
jgi:hypothetical protein